MRPIVQLINTDGNAFSIIGACSKALTKAGMKREATEFQSRAWNAPSYDALLQLCMEYVEVS